MRSSFFGLNIAVRGLYTAQSALNVVNHNINNVNTPGFSRQQAIQSASAPMAVLDGTGMIGTGSDVTTIKRVRDEYLDFKYWSENVSYGEWAAKQEVLSDLEVTFNEPSDSGFTTIMNDFYSSLQELAKDPGSEAVRALVQQKGVTLAKYFNSMAEHLEKLQADINYRINTKVEEVNSYATQIQQLNRQIYIAELDGSNANDLRDQRTLLVDKMSKIINVEANEVVVGKLPDGRDDKHFVITISGKAIVDHFNISKLKVEQRDAAHKLNAEDVDDLYEVKWADGNSLKVKSGELRGYLDMRDGNEGQLGLDGNTQSPMYKGIPFYTKKLNEFVRTFAMAFNEGDIDLDGDGTILDVDLNGDGTMDLIENGNGHIDGYGTTGVTDLRFFTMVDEATGQSISNADFLALSGGTVMNKYQHLTAKNFAVSSDILNNFNLIATADAAGEEGNIEILNELLGTRHNSQMFTEGAPEDFMKALVATLGIDSQQAVNYSDNQQAIVEQIENRRFSDSGVSLDEEMANMVKFQHAYNASAKMIQTMSEVYDTLINKLGVG